MKLVTYQFWPLIWPLRPLFSILAFFGLFRGPLCLTTLLSSFLVHISTLGLFRWIYPKTAIVGGAHRFFILNGFQLEWTTYVLNQDEIIFYRSFLDSKQSKCPEKFVHLQKIIEIDSKCGSVHLYCFFNIKIQEEVIKQQLLTFLLPHLL